MKKEQLYRSDAELLYMKGGTLEEIAAVVPVSVNTLSSWSKKHGWSERRSRLSRHPLAMAEKIDLMLVGVVDDIVNAGGKVTGEQVDQMSKLSAVRRHLGQTSDYASQVVKVTDDLARFAQGYLKNEEDAGTFAGLLQAFYTKVKEHTYGN